MIVSTWRAVALVALTASVIVAEEVLLTRVLSVTTWDSLAFVVINLAMLGLTDRAMPYRSWRRSREFCWPCCQ